MIGYGFFRDIGASNQKEFEKSIKELVSLANEFIKFDSIETLLYEMSMQLNFNFDDYLDNLEKLHPECWERSEKNPDGEFNIERAEYLEYLRFRRDFS